MGSNTIKAFLPFTNQTSTLFVLNFREIFWNSKLISRNSRILTRTTSARTTVRRGRPSGPFRGLRDESDGGGHADPTRGPELPGEVDVGVEVGVGVCGRGVRVDVGVGVAGVDVDVGVEVGVGV